MGQPISSGYYVCANKGGVVPLVSLFYYAPGATNVATCTFDDHNLILGGEYTSFTLPPDWTQWGGTLDVVWKLVSVDPKTGLFISYMFADEAFQLSGANNACAELATHSSG